MNDTLIGPTEAARQLGIERNWVHRLAVRLNIGTIIAGRRLFSPNDLNAIQHYRITHPPNSAIKSSRD